MEGHQLTRVSGVRPGRPPRPTRAAPCPSRSSSPRNAWSLFNPSTGVYREIDPHTALRRGEALHGLFDAVVGMS